MTDIIKQVQEACAEICEQYTYAENAAALIRALDLSHLTGWQDISTAPKDGTDVLAVVIGFTPTVAYFDGVWKFIDPSEWDESSSYEPTHWMPLPPAPTKELNK